MKRYSAFDPPEYLHWAPETELIEEYKARIHNDPERTAVLDQLSPEKLLELYRHLLLTRLFDIGLKRWVRTGIISKAWLGTGEEAVTVGAVATLRRGLDLVSPMIRNAGALHMMGMPLADMFRGYLATQDSPNGGRDLHIGDLTRGIFQPVSPMGINLPVITGAAMALQRKGDRGVAVTWVGDGATRCAACHEGANFAAVQRVPVVFIVQNNQVAMGTRVDQHAAGDLASWAAMYGLPCLLADGNNILDMYTATRLAVARCRSGRGPVVILANTFRMGGHATHDEREARDTFSDELFRHWGARDPVGLYEQYLMGRGIDGSELEKMEAACIAAVDGGAAEALASRKNVPAAEYALMPGVSEGGTLVGLERRPI